MRASKWYKAKPVNVVNQEWHDDGSVTVRIYVEGWRRAYKFKARNLHGVGEETVEDEEVGEDVVV